MSQYLYDHNTAHILEPVQGYDIVSFMNFWAPLSDKILDLNKATGVMAVPGTVMHRDEKGELYPGLTKTSMPQFLYAKQDSEDVLQSPVTANGQNITGVGIMSYGGFNTAPYQNDSNTQQVFYGNGIASNAGPINYDVLGPNGGPKLTIKPQKSAFTTFPGACGLEFGSSEFAKFKGDGSEVAYNYDDPLTSPEPLIEDPSDKDSIAAGYAAVKDADPGTKKQQVFGGFLKKGTYYKDNICGVLSQKPFRNENGTWMIRFWACHKPAIDLEAVGAVASDSAPAITVTGGSIAGSVAANGDVSWTGTPTTTP